MQPEIKTLIVYEDQHIIVCHKPAGISVQSARIGAADLVSLLKNHLASSGKDSSANEPPYLAVIHRLDQPVEGLLVFAKTPAAAKILNRQLTSSGFGKYYRAVVVGIPDPSEGNLEDYLIKDGRANISRVCTKETPGAKQARLHYRVEKIYNDSRPVTSLVKIKLDTGRHHQIRVQMAQMGCPLVGDRKYGDISDSRSVSGSLVCKNTSLKLCAYRLDFKHPATGKDMTFELPYIPEA